MEGIGMEQSNEIIRAKILQTELMPVQWDKDGAWSRVAANRPAANRSSRLAIAASIAVVLLGVSVIRTSDPLADQAHVASKEIVQPVLPHVTEEITAKNTTETMVAKKSIGHDKKQAAEPESVNVQIPTSENTVAENVIQAEQLQPEQPIAVSEDITVLPVTQKVRPLLGVIPVEHTPVELTSKTGPRLVLMQRDNRATAKEESHTKLILARIK
jgi:hypothetical protein